MAHLKTLPLYVALLFAAACSQPGVKASQPVAVESQAQQPVEAAVEVAADPEAEALAQAQAALPRQPLTPEILFGFLVAEVAAQRGAIGIAQSTYLDLARQTQDPRIARRAVEVSMFARNQAGALEAARLWAAAERDSERARQTLAALLLNEGSLGEAEPILRTLLKEDSANGFLHLSALMGKLRDTRRAGTGRAPGGRPSGLAGGAWRSAQAAASAGIRCGGCGLAAGRQPASGWEPGALLYAQILAKRRAPDALAFHARFLARHPGAREVRLAYARTLVNATSLPKHAVEFAPPDGRFSAQCRSQLCRRSAFAADGRSQAARDLLTQTPRIPRATPIW
jgi:predicted Zn-dependent protease